MEIIATLLGILSVWLAKEKSWVTWAAGLVSCILLVIVFKREGLYASAGLQRFYIMMSCIGLLNWTRIKYKGHISNGTCLLLVGLVTWGLTAITTNYIDTLSAALAIVATTLLILEDPRAWLLYITSNVCSIIVCLQVGLYIVTIQYIIFIIISKLGYDKWVSDRKIPPVPYRP